MATLQVKNQRNKKVWKTKRDRFGKQNETVRTIIIYYKKQSRKAKKKSPRQIVAVGLKLVGKLTQHFKQNLLLYIFYLSK